MSEYCKRRFAHNVVAIGINCAFRRGDVRDVADKCDRFIKEMMTCCAEHYSSFAVGFLRVHGMSSVDAERLVIEAVERVEASTRTLTAV